MELYQTFEQIASFSLRFAVREVAANTPGLVRLASLLDNQTSYDLLGLILY